MEELISPSDMAALKANGRHAALDPSYDPYAVICLRAPDGPQLWLLAEVDAEDEDLAYGLCDLGIGLPEPGSVSIRWLAAWRGRLGMRLEKDRTFASAAPLRLSTLARVAAAAGRIVT